MRSLHSPRHGVVLGVGARAGERVLVEPLAALVVEGVGDHDGGVGVRAPLRALVVVEQVVHVLVRGRGGRADSGAVRHAVVLRLLVGNQVRLEVVGVGRGVVHVLVDLHGHQHGGAAHEHTAAAHHAQEARGLVDLVRLGVGAHGSGGQVLANHLFAVDVAHNTLTGIQAQFESGIAARHRRNGDGQRVVTRVRSNVGEGTGNVGLPRRIQVVAPVVGALGLGGVPPPVQHGNDVVGVEGDLLSRLVLQAAAENLDIVHNDVEVGSVRPARGRPANEGLSEHVHIAQDEGVRSLHNAQLDLGFKISAALSRLRVQLLSSASRASVDLQLFIHGIGAVDTMDHDMGRSILADKR